MIILSIFFYDNYLYIFVKHRVLGHNAIHIHNLNDEVGVTKNQVRIRLRGIGSGFYENNQQELQQPLHFNVSAETEDLLKIMVDKVKAHVAICKADFELRN